ncbi:MAG: hypothetical protein BJ554DRAFT_1648 [Olpidium bornovanus]|uniref:Uncharacterized protein n=1 Tax=Olpidium bornovanus TaxID=278681 RepID=A0A8H7ZS39_9FUNG|nr:MAG: hypothetical protein BJ554DRAFT_1648 [Olpidium bornovanus]
MKDDFWRKFLRQCGPMIKSYTVIKAADAESTAKKIVPIPRWCAPLAAGVVAVAAAVVAFTSVTFGAGSKFFRDVFAGLRDLGPI